MSKWPTARFYMAHGFGFKIIYINNYYLYKYYKLVLFMAWDGLGFKKKSALASSPRTAHHTQLCAHVLRTAALLVARRLL